MLDILVLVPMARKKSKLLAALDAHQGIDYKLEKQRALRKKAARQRAALSSNHKNSGATNSSQIAYQLPKEETNIWKSQSSEDNYVHIVSSISKCGLIVAGAVLMYFTCTGCSCFVIIRTFQGLNTRT